MSSIWNSCLSRLENEISTNDLNTWIRPLQAQEESDVIKLLAPNQFIQLLKIIET
jgi:chromosomal replication initiator protein